ncbi:MAG: Sporulation kinase E [Firmicutes bacterium]|nr:Sporulation kinase E [Bacillota bacterium]
MTNRRFCRRVDLTAGQLQAIMSACSDAIFSCDLKDAITSWNLAAERLFKLTETQALESSVWILLPVHHMEEVLAQRKKAYHQNSPVTLEIKMQIHRGELFDAAITVSAVRGAEDKCAGFVTLVKDIREQKRMAQGFARSDQLHMLGELAAGVTHEVRNPLTIVKGFLQLFRPREEFAMYRMHFDLMIKELDRINGLISQYLSLGQYAHAEKQLCSLTSVVESLLPLIQAESLLREVEVTTSLDDNLPLLWLYEKEIKQLLLNLIQNGMDAMKQGRRELSIKAWNEQDSVVLSIEDTGCGIPEHVMENLFTPFYSTKESGTGLGLVVCRDIARRHNAEIKIRTDTTGTCFAVVFPVANLTPPLVG